MLNIKLNNESIIVASNFSSEKLTPMINKIKGLKINPPDRTTLTFTVGDLKEAEKLQVFLSEYLGLPINFLTVRDGYEYITTKLGKIKFKINGTN